ncbi:hypothetical protein B9Z19DRAFT_1163170 [Tuber borchii]|uniref:Uncharacterized protein n=1 Tax=Tuber borchii TaxID=42251 RepID=A0A2T6ZDC5_TUBBO|nr:hypothetical protein B9Z19DRAFT_1163170 [Tuber borchii]
MMSPYDSSSALVVASHLMSPGIADSATSSLALPSVACINLAALIPASNKFKYPGASHLANLMAARVHQWIQAENECYIHVLGVKEAMMESIDNAFKNVGIRSAVRFTFEQDLAALIIECKLTLHSPLISRPLLHLHTPLRIPQYNPISCILPDEK